MPRSWSYYSCSAEGGNGELYNHHNGGGSMSWGAGFDGHVTAVSSGIKNYLTVYVGETKSVRDSWTSPNTGRQEAFTIGFKAGDTLICGTEGRDTGSSASFTFTWYAD